jgi:hypothetical protein
MRLALSVRFDLEKSLPEGELEVRRLSRRQSSDRPEQRQVQGGGLQGGGPNDESLAYS